jgi:hypothetical protein
MELSENLKLRLDSPSGDEQPHDGPSGASPPAHLSQHHSSQPHISQLGRSELSGGHAGPGTDDTGGSGGDASSQNDEAESQMRKALGLLGESPRNRTDADRMDQPSRMGDRFNGGLHRRRFVQDGDIPVTVLRRDQNHDVPAHRGVAAPAAPTSSRLQRTEAVLAAETAAREKAERSLAETHSVVRDLQTKIGHAELAKSEAIDALRRERETHAQLRSDLEAMQERLVEALEQVRLAEHSVETCQEQLADERQARKVIEKALRAAESGREAAEQLVRALSEEAPAAPAPQPYRRQRVVAEPEVVARRGRPDVVTAEPEPVKWWLNTKANGKKR